MYTTLLAEQCEFYDDMLYFMRHFIKNNEKVLNSDERNLFSIACKNYMSKNQKAYRTMIAFENKEKKKENSNYLPYVKDYRIIVENILYEKCQGNIKFIDDNIIKKDNFRNYDDEGKTFFYKMMGDYNRFICESESFKSKCINEADKYYKEAFKISNKLPIYNPVKLGLILNTTVFYYDTLENKKKAIELAESAVKKFNDEARKLNKDEDEVKDAMDIYNLMKENLDMWKAEA